MGSGQGDDVFPRTVTHFQGSTEITQAPTRVVITGTGQLDIALTLGFVPVGSTAGDGAELIPSYLAEAFPQDAAYSDSTTMDIAVDRMTGHGVPAHQIWLPPLEISETFDSLVPDLVVDRNLGLTSPSWRARGDLVVPLGITDVPLEQRRETLTVDLSGAGGHVAVIGGGNSGVEAAIDLAGVVDHVTLFEFMPELRADAVLQRKLESLPNVKILKNVQVTEVKASNDKVSAIVYKDRTNDSIHEVALEGVFVQIGLVPNTDFLKDSGITLVRNGEIQVDVRGQTSMEGVFAAGDCTTSPYKQIIIAAGDGAKAALAAFDHLIRTSAPK